MSFNRDRTGKVTKGLLPCIGLLVMLLVFTSLTAGARAPVLVDGDQAPRFEPADCPVPVPETVACGYLVVPEDRTQPGSRTIRLAVAILPSHSDHPAPDPVVYLEGGPGGSALEGMDHWLGSPILDSRDLILLEQRGTQYSEPWLDCPELKETYIDNWQRGLSGEEEVKREVQAAIECRDRLRREGANLAAYHSAASAADLADLRQALGYDQWNLYGISYGTRLALTAMRDHPDGIRSVILDSVYPPPVEGLVEIAPNTARVFDKLFDDCAADPACQAAYPDLESDFYEVIERANAEPIFIRARHPEDGKFLDLPVDGEDLVGILFIALYDSSLIPYLPQIIDQMYLGNSDVLLPLIEFALEMYLSGSEGMGTSVNCSEEVPFNPPEAIAAAAEAVPPLLRAFSYTSTWEICDLWGTGDAQPIEDEPVYSDIPTLVLEGEYDPITPPAFGRLAAETLSNSFYYQFPGLGHGVTLLDCPASMAVAFLEDPHTEPDSRCLEELTNPDFSTGQDFNLTPAAYRILAGLNSGDSPFPWALGFAGLCFLLAGYVWVWALLRLLRIWPGPYPRGDWLFHGLLAGTSILNQFFLVGLGAMMFGTVLSDWSILIFGLPSGSALLLWMPWMSGFLTAGLVAFMVVAWIRKKWPLAWRVLYSLATASLVAFIGFLAYWDLLGL